MQSDKTAIRDVIELEELLSEPTDGVVRTLAALDGDILVLGAGGKMGPTLARMAKRASEAAGVKRRVIGVSRFSSPALEAAIARVGRRDCTLRPAGSRRRWLLCPMRLTSSSWLA